MNSNSILKKHFSEYARPMIIRSVFSSLMHTADRFVAALYIGASALVATTLVSPLMFLVASMALIFISGLGAYVGLLIGKDKVEKANQVSSGIILIMLVVGVAMTIPTFFFSEQLSYFLGARGEFLILSTDYLKIFSFAFPLIMIGRVLDVLMLNDGSPSYSFMLNIVTSVSNLLLNLLSVIVLGWGIKGLALATVISSGIQLLGGVWYFFFKSKILHLRKPSMHIPTILRIIYNGFSDFAMTIVEAVMIFVINIAFVRFLTPNHFEAYAVVSMIMSLFYGIYMGSSMGLQPIISKMMGGKEFSTLTRLLNYSVKRTLLYGFVVYLTLIPVIKQVLMLFIDNQVTLELGVFFYLTLGLATLFSNYPLQMSIFFTSLNRPMESALISILRTLVFIPPIVFFLIKSLGPGGVALGFITSDIIMIIGIITHMKKTDLSTLKVYE